MSAGCSYCGAPVKARDQGGRTHSVNAWSETRYECGTKSHSDGVDRSAECERRAAERDAAKTEEAEVFQADRDSETGTPTQGTAAVLVADTLEPVREAPVPAPSLEAQVAAWTRQTEDAARAAVTAVEGVTVIGHAEGPAKGRKAAEAARLALKRVRTPIEAKRKELKAPIVALGKLVDAEAARLTGIVQPREEELEREINAYDAEQARIQREVEEAERARIQARVDLVVSLGVTPDLAMVRELDEEAFAAWADELRAAKEIRDAEEAARQEAERVRLEAEAAERARLIAEETVRQEAEAARIKAQIAAKDAEIEEARREAARLRKEAEDAKAEIQRIQNAAAKAKEDAERVIREEAERIEREASEAAELAAAEARREALRPDREKIVAWCTIMAEAVLPPPVIEDADLRASLDETRLDILNRINLLKTETQENA